MMPQNPQLRKTHKPKKPTIQEISPFAFGEVTPLSKSEKVWVAFASLCFLITLDAGITMGLSLVMVSLTSLGKIIWQKIHPIPEAEAPSKK